MEWKEERKKWALQWVDLQTDKEGIYEADIVVHGTGLFNIPNIPQEFDAFTGIKWHSARWRNDVDLSNKRVGVIGVNARYSVTWKFLFSKVPFFYALYVTFWYYALDSTFLVYFRMTWYSAIHRAIVYFTAWWQRYRQIRDPILRAKLTPNRVVGSRRAVLSNTFYPTLTRDHVEYHREEITDVSGNKITTADGETRELDILIMATGFAIPKNFPPGYWVGKGGVDITDTWAPIARTYFGVCTPGAPNFFMAWGPMSGSFHQSITSVIEAQVMFMIKTLSTMMENDYASMEITEKATKNYVDMAMKRFALSAANVTTPLPPPALSPASDILFKKKRVQHTKPSMKFTYWCSTLAEFRYRLSHYSPQLFTSVPQKRLNRTN
ncbi:hypothetical protein FBU30_006942 [Linnemannia zychae]|nr:hypothetical protein FBU30_006942 [Linnemannia zychae]